MRATEIIRGVLDLIDQVECAQEAPVQQDPIGGAFAQLFAQLVNGKLYSTVMTKSNGA